MRSSVPDYKRRDILEAERIDGSAGYTLSASARMILDSGDRRIFNLRPRVPRRRLDPRDLLVPESERRKRHLLRTRLAWLGYGTVSAGVWVAPAHLEEETREVLCAGRPRWYVDLFWADYLGFGDLEHETGTWWDLTTINSLYLQFHEQHAPLLASWRARSAQGRRRRRRSPTTCGRSRRGAGCPSRTRACRSSCFPQSWAWCRECNTFDALKRRLEAPAHRFVEEVRRA